MAQPDTYTRRADFSAFAASQPTAPHSGVNLDAEFNAAKATLDQILANLVLIQRDDGRLGNNSVGNDQLKAEVTIGLNAATNWETATPYSANDAVFESDKLYRCLVAHTSGTFATDLAAVKWSLILDLSAYGEFGVVYLGSKTSDPALDNNGDALIAGALYYNSSDTLLKYYTGSAWVALPSGPDIAAVAAIDTEIGTVAGIAADVTTAAANVADITNFADVYIGAAASNPTQRADTSALQAGDLYFNTGSNVMRVYNGATWDDVAVTPGSFLQVSNDLSDLNSAATARTNLSAAALGANTFTGAQNFGGFSATDIGGTTFDTTDKGSVASGTVTFNVSDDSKQKLTVTGALTIAFAGWPTTGNYAEVEIELVNGSTNVTFPTINWTVGDGTTSTTFADTGITLASSGTNHIIVWSTDGGTTLYGVAS
jgi:hypothetical protein